MTNVAMNLLHATTREEWRAWLQKNYKTAPEIYLVSHRKASGKPSIPYNQTVEEALCFGWIDSVKYKVDDEALAQRFTPRRARSPFSQVNKERLRKLLAQGKVVDEVLVQVPDIGLDEFAIGPDIDAALRANTKAWENFQRYKPAYQRIRLGFIEAARNRPEEFAKRLKHFLNKTEQDKQFGVGIEEFYGRVE